MIPAVNFFYYVILFACLLVLFSVHMLTVESIKLAAITSPIVNNGQKSKFQQLIREKELIIKALEQKIIISKQEIKNITKEQKKILVNFNRITQKILDKKELDEKFLSKVKKRLLGPGGNH
jgi:hypothetical protein